jgi:hypothetical protein
MELQQLHEARAPAAKAFLYFVLSHALRRFVRRFV